MKLSNSPWADPAAANESAPASPKFSSGSAESTKVSAIGLRVTFVNAEAPAPRNPTAQKLKTERRFAISSQQ
jgi:hypothetical protein